MKALKSVYANRHCHKELMASWALFARRVVRINFV